MNFDMALVKAARQFILQVSNLWNTRQHQNKQNLPEQFAFSNRKSNCQ